MHDPIVPLNPPPANLEALVARTRAFVATSKSANTLRGYRSDWADWLSWAAAQKFCALPAEPATVALYLADRSATLRAATLARRLNAISFYHRQAGVIDSPTHAPLVRATFQGIRRTIGTAQTFKRALLTPEIRRIVACCPETLAGLRDKALVLISFSMAARRSESAGLRAEDLEEVPEGILVTIRKSKVDQEASGRKVGIPFGTDDATCPVRALTIYMEAAGIVAGFVFRAIDQKGCVSPFGLHSDSVGYILKRAAARAGLKIEDIGGHSLRSGFCTEAARQNVPTYLIRRQARFKPGSKTLDRYIRLGEMFTKNAAAGVGL
jgi:site-specific recombinase XerD